MNRTEWLNRLEALHVDIREGKATSDEDRTWYRAARAALLGAALEVQALSLGGEDRPRSSIRLTRAVRVLLEARGWSVQTLTVDLGAGGFAVLLEAPPPVNEWIRATLVRPGEGPVISTVAVADAAAADGLYRVAFRLSEPSRETQERFESAVVDSVLEQLVFWEDVLERLHG